MNQALALNAITAQNPRILSTLARRFGQPLGEFSPLHASADLSVWGWGNALGSVRLTVGSDLRPLPRTVARLDVFNADGFSTGKFWMVYL